MAKAAATPDQALALAAQQSLKNFGKREEGQRRRGLTALNGASPKATMKPVVSKEKESPLERGHQMLHRRDDGDGDGDDLRRDGFRSDGVSHARRERELSGEPPREPPAPVHRFPRSRLSSLRLERRVSALSLAASLDPRSALRSDSQNARLTLALCHVPASMRMKVQLHQRREGSRIRPPRPSCAAVV